jgi:hypothetical protein
MAFDYSSRDYSTIKQDLLNRASVVAPEWTDRDPSDFGMLLVDLWAYMGDIFHYYIDRAAGESFVDTATQRESVLAYANLFDYKPNYRTSATATVTIANAGASVGIPEETEFVAQYDNKFYYFYSTTGASVPAEGSSTINVVEGERVTEEVLTTSASGEVGQRYVLRSENIAPDSVRVFVYEDPASPSEWQKVDSIYTVNTGVGAFVVYVNADEETEIYFGNRINGRIPPAGVRITASYTISNGEDGNLPANTITAFRNSVSADLTIQSSSAATGGQNIESVESIKRAIKSVTRSQNRAVTLRDYADLAINVSGASKTVASYNSGTSTVTVYAVPYVNDYTSFTGASVPIPTAMQDEAEALLQPLAMAGVTVTAATNLPVYRVDMDVTVKVLDRYVAPWIERDVVSAIDSLFQYDDLFIGQEIRIGEVYRAIFNVVGVEYAVVTSYGIYDASNALVTNMPEIGLLRKGTVNLTISGGISTS